MNSFVSGAVLAFLLPAVAPAQTVFVEQGPDWTASLRSQFYTQDQGSRIMPIIWMRALKAPDGNPFLHDALARYGYLPMPERADADLPVGFTTNGTGSETAIGMTCAACHTREIDVSGTAYRVDGGPAMVDFQAFLRDLDDAVLMVLNDEGAWDDFATAVLGQGAGESDIKALRAKLEIWSNRYHTLVDRSLPDPAWAPGRLDAVTMIFNRLTGLDIGPLADDGIIADNIKVADAPARYPFLWNAAIHDYTQWPGFAANGNDLLGLSRNLGEVYGVFGEFRPVEKRGILFDNDYISQNSANWDGLKELEDWIGDIGAPEWSWELDQDLAMDGKAIFELPTAEGGCVECHGKKKGEFRSFKHETLATPIKAVGTDERECQILETTVDTGTLEGAKIPLVGTPLGKEARAFDVLALSVLGAIIQHATDFLSEEDRQIISGLEAELEGNFGDAFSDLEKAFPITQKDGSFPTVAAADPGCAYEARVLEGIWAAAPYLHNGWVPTLTDLLKKPADRPMSYVPGPAYDIEAVGLAKQQTMFDQTVTLTGCDDVTSGNSNCGHTFGTDLSEDQKQALIEYLKSI